MTSLPDSPVHSGREQDFGQWYEEYAVKEGNDFFKNDPLILAVKSDKLDADFIERRILEAIPTLPVTKGFCIKCQDLFDNWPTLGDSNLREHDSKPTKEQGWEHGVARSMRTYELEASTRSGCRFCTFLLQGLKDAELLDVFRKIESRLFHLEKDAACSLSIQNWGTNPCQLLWLNLPGKVCTSCNEGIALSVKFDSSFLPASANCHNDPVDVLDISSHWLSTCSGSHKACKSSQGELPTRLISIGGKFPKLQLSVDCLERPRYATLSHSWGSHDVIKLLSQNLGSYMEALPVAMLPATFIHAIEITRKLGLDYLWIDSLCIIQDNEADWQRESALMSSVYGGAEICIAASSARDSTEGCFMTQPQFSGGLRARITDGGRCRVQDFRSEEVYNLSTFNTHLGTRAWALQEKMLPPRTIHFGDRGAFWECRTNIASEFLPDGFPRILNSPLVKRRAEFKYLWTQIVRLYSAANLTFGKDKLPALSGVAKLSHAETGDQYLAGLWRSQIEEQLCWIRQSEPDLIRPAWRAPTWSWASVDGQISWRRLQDGILGTKYVHILNASTTLLTEDHFGQVTAGVIRLTCSSMISGRLVPGAKSGKDAYKILLQAGKEEIEFPFVIDCLQDGQQDKVRPVYLLPFLSGWTGAAISGVRETAIIGVVLRPTGNTKGEFSRIGAFWFYKDFVIWMNGNDEIADASYEPFLRIMEEQGSKTAEAACAEVISTPEHPDERYVITII